MDSILGVLKLCTYSTANHNLCNVNVLRGQTGPSGFLGNILFTNLDYYSWQPKTNEYIFEGFNYLVENTQRSDNGSFLFPSLDSIGFGNLDRYIQPTPNWVKNDNRMTFCYIS